MTGLVVSSGLLVTIHVASLIHQSPRARRAIRIFFYGWSS